MLYVSADQKFEDADNAKAAAVGLVEGAISGYDLRHGKQMMRRAIASWTRR